MPSKSNRDTGYIFSRAVIYWLFEALFILSFQASPSNLNPVTVLDFYCCKRSAMINLIIWFRMKFFVFDIDDNLSPFSQKIGWWQLIQNRAHSGYLKCWILGVVHKWRHLLWEEGISKDDGGRERFGWRWCHLLALYLQSFPFFTGFMA